MILKSGIVWRSLFDRTLVKMTDTTKTTASLGNNLIVSFLQHIVPVLFQIIGNDPVVRGASHRTVVSAHNSYV